MYSFGGPEIAKPNLLHKILMVRTPKTKKDLPHLEQEIKKILKYSL